MANTLQQLFSEIIVKRLGHKFMSQVVKTMGYMMGSLRAHKYLSTVREEKYWK